MKKSMTMIAVVGLAGCLVMSGCSNGGSSDTNAETSSAETVQAASSKQPETAAKYAVTIDDGQVTTDYAGKPALLVTYTWTNNSDKATSFMVAVSGKAFQNGVQLDSAIVSGADTSASMNEIKPGATTTVQQAYVLDDQTDVTVECTELISFDDTLIAERVFSVA